MRIEPTHPRAVSLLLREKLVAGVKLGITSQAGLIAHGRGEAFDYLIGEETRSFSQKAITAAAAYLLLASQSVLSANGNTAMLCGKEFGQLAKLLGCKIEVNLFHYSSKRTATIEKHLRLFAGRNVLIRSKEQKIVYSSIASQRKISLRSGIGGADVVFVPLEDGDRCEALVGLGKKVITVDLNPLSRTAQKATVTIVDNITRAMPKLIAATVEMRGTPKQDLVKIISSYDNRQTIAEALRYISSRLQTLAAKDQVLSLREK